MGKLDVPIEELVKEHRKTIAHARSQHPSVSLMDLTTMKIQLLAKLIDCDVHRVYTLASQLETRPANIAKTIKALCIFGFVEEYTEHKDSYCRITNLGLKFYDAIKDMLDVKPTE